MLMGGLLGSGHCVGMCGGFVVTIGASQSGARRAFVRQAMYALGRMFTYGFLGALAGLVGAQVQGWSASLVDAQRVLSMAAGVMMIAIGLSNLGLVPWRMGVRVDKGKCGVFGGSILGHFVHSQGYGASLLAGMFTGFLPCGLVYTFLLLAVRSADPMWGWLGMVAFGLGTAPALAALGCGSAMLSRMARIRIARAAAVFVVVLGAVTIGRGVPGGKSCCGGAAPGVEQRQASSL